MKRKRYWILAYAVGAVFTFLWSASDPRHCTSFNCPDYLMGAAAGANAGFWWPLYWLWEGAERLRGPDAYVQPKEPTP